MNTNSPLRLGQVEFRSPKMKSVVVVIVWFWISGSTQCLEKRNVLTFPPSSALQLNVGVSLARKLERNGAAIVLGFQLNAPLFNDTEHLFFPSSVVTAREFPVYDRLSHLIGSYGFNGTECLSKMICQLARIPLLSGGLMEDLLTFVLSPSKHRRIQGGNVGENEKQFLESERFGQNGGDCDSAFSGCAKTPLDFISRLMF